jgi:hypothetical protein
MPFRRPDLSDSRVASDVAQAADAGMAFSEAEAGVGAAEFAEFAERGRRPHCPDARVAKAVAAYGRLAAELCGSAASQGAEVVHFRHVVVQALDSLELAEARQLPRRRTHSGLDLDDVEVADVAFFGVLVAGLERPRRR